MTIITDTYLVLPPGVEHVEVLVEGGVAGGFCGFGFLASLQLSIAYLGQLILTTFQLRIRLQGQCAV